MSNNEISLLTLGNSEQTFLEAEREAARGMLPVNPGDFRKHVWDIFDREIVVSVLLDPKSSYVGHKEALFSALCGWIVGRGNIKFVRNSAAFATIDTLAKVEKKAMAHFDEASILADMSVRAVLGSRFLSEIYYPIGGIAFLSQALSRKGYRRLVKKQTAGLIYALEVMRIYHHHAAYLSEAELYRPPSLNTASDLPFKLMILPKGEAPQGRAVRDYWSLWKGKIALLYAAHTMQLGNETLLSAILKNKVGLGEKYPALSEWLGRAAYVANHVLTKCAEQETSKANLQNLPEIAAIPFEVESYDDLSAEVIRAAFRHKK